MTTPAAQPQPPVIMAQVRRGSPTPEDIAAVSVVLAMLAAGPDSQISSQTAGWANRARMMTGEARVGQGWGAQG
jgi:hypothetical protein